MFLYSSTNALKSLDTLYPEFPSAERALIENTFKTYFNEEIKFHFICFNYARTLDKCLAIESSLPNGIGRHRYGNAICRHTIGNIIHIHGTVDKNMVLGVNDESQIANPELFSDDFFKHFLIKVESNRSYQKNTDKSAHDLLDSSQIIYIYGMALGATDNLWWTRVANWLARSDHHHVIIHCYDAPEPSAFSFQYQLFERDFRANFASHGNFNEKQQHVIMNRIHITKRNLFESIKNIANNPRLYNSDEAS